MSDDEMRVAIAEWCGWRVEICGAAWILRRPDNTVASSGHRADHDIQSLYDYARTWVSEMPWPNYPADLNAMHEAEDHLSREQIVHYCNFALRATTGEGNVTDYKMIRATARQRAEALLRTIGKWKD